MTNELIVREHPVVVRERSEDNHEDKNPDRTIDAKHKIIRESRFNKDKAKRIPGQVGRLAKEVGKTVWGYTIGHKSNEERPSISSPSTTKRNERAFHPDDVVARRSAQVIDTTGPFWSSNSLGGGRSPLNQTIGQSFSWGLQSPRRSQTSLRYNKKYKRSKTWKKRR